jgi:hypothetical protein
MFNEFLTTTLQVIIALNVAGLIAYFCLGSRRRPTQTTTETVAVDPQSPWNKLVQPCKRALGAQRPLAATAATSRPGETMDSALDQLRRVLDGYGHGLR